MNQRVPINKEEYSESSKRSFGFESLGDFYESIRYQCKKCTRSEVFTAEEQKVAYEVKKRYMWQSRFLCNSCYKEMICIKAELAEMEDYYCHNKEEVLNNREFLVKWLRLLNDYPTYCKKSNFSRITFVKKALGLA